ncbi:cytochrome c551 [Bacillus sp. JCM 19046]|uniref:Mono/diheme cytochrome c family protein n=1 Tax=Shouchella xiaoxiensis TaxID=766895 RepID=A0ABS2SSE4_9BACI|nr:cytochrome c [Shouchella xiaoxiensis]MBM7838111.1 mono/diheme cytochrome c family protein [Shouchella xiaoxiensis]GAF11988.1 cytochrome c551 [Bacillus sp. JCM 19045]GAF18006.1 cytochrome c551 [Bacillus sp. JCM 19046]
MKGRPLIPFAFIALLGIVLMVVFSAIGQQERAGRDEEGEEAPEAPEITDAIEYGQGIVEQSCISCHANDLGGTDIAPAINNLSGQLSEDEIVDIVTNGQGGMPEFGSSLHPDEIDAIAEYLLSLSE